MLFQRNDTVLFIGDSITDYNRARPVGEGLNNAWGTSYAAMASSLLCAMYPELHLRMINMGISGNQVRDLDKRWQTDVLDLKPDWVVVLIGINDVWRQFDSPSQPELHVPPEEYRATYQRLLEETLPTRQGHGTPDALFHGAEPGRPHARTHGRIRPDCQGAGGAVRFALRGHPGCLGRAVPAHAPLQYRLGPHPPQPGGLHVPGEDLSCRRGL